MNISNQLILVTGGAGYIGSHTVVKLLEAGVGVVILDNFSNSKKEVINRIKAITGKNPELVVGDLRDRKALSDLFKKYKIDSVIHFAGLKAVGESVEMPLKYYDNNVLGSIILIQEMVNAKVSSLIFSSSATVYGNPSSVPITEDSQLIALNPYAQSKLMVENILRDLFKSNESLWKIAILRYFNPVGAHYSGLIGEDPRGAPNNLMPYLSQVAVGRREKLFIYGADYLTKDGTGVRDYLHVEDLAVGHISALQALNREGGLKLVNLGTGRGYSVKEVIKTFERVSGVKIPFEFTDRRQGDVAVCFADPKKAKVELNWSAQYDIDRMCTDAWRWQQMNPNGFNDSISGTKS